MKRRSLKTLLFMFIVACLFSLSFVSASAADKTVGDFVFSVSGGTATLKEYKGRDADVVIPSKAGTAKVTTIGNEAFWGNKTMKTVSIPSTVTVIGTAAFNECSSLTRVVLPSKLTALGDAVFWYCTNLKQVFIPKTVTSIGENVFTGCNSKLTVYVVKGSFAESRMAAYPQTNWAYRYITSLKLSKSSLTLAKGSSETLVYTYSPVNVYSSKVTYTSSDTKVAAVDSSGKITAKGVGAATITCTTKDGGKVSAKCTVNVVPTKVTSIKLTNQTLNGYTLSWGKSDGATKYNVYLYNSSTKKYESYKITTATSLNISGLKAGSTQQYKIKAYAKVDGKNYCASVSSVYKASVAKPGKVTEITAKPAVDYINLSWKATSLATSYRVYLYDRTASKYIFLGETAKTSFKVMELDPDTQYTFMVRAKAKTSNGNAYSSYSPLTDCATRPEYVTGFSLVEGSVYTSKMTLKWNKIKGATGYQIALYNKSTDAYEIFERVRDSSAVECTLTDLLPGTEYQFRIRAYVTRGTNTTYGYYSSGSLKVTTNDRPADAKEAFNAFDEAYLSSKLSDDSFTLVSIYGAEDINSEDNEAAQTVITASDIGNTVFSYIVNGKDRATDEAVGNLICSAEDFTAIESESITPIGFEDDGNGFRLSFTAKAEAVPSLIRLPAFNNAEDITVDCVTYSEATVTAKVQGSDVDDISVSVPVEVTYTVGEEQKSFTAVITATYLFIR